MNEFQLEHGFGSKPSTVNFLHAINITECVDASSAIFRWCWWWAWLLWCCSAHSFMIGWNLAWNYMCFPSTYMNIPDHRIDRTNQVSVRHHLISRNGNDTWPYIRICNKWRELFWLQIIFNQLLLFFFFVRRNLKGEKCEHDSKQRPSTDISVIF